MQAYNSYRVELAINEWQEEFNFLPEPIDEELDFLEEMCYDDFLTLWLKETLI